MLQKMVCGLLLASQVLFGFTEIAWTACAHSDGRAHLEWAGLYCCEEDEYGRSEEADDCDSLAKKDADAISENSACDDTCTHYPVSCDRIKTAEQRKIPERVADHTSFKNAMSSGNAFATAFLPSKSLLGGRNSPAGSLPPSWAVCCRTVVLLF